MGKKNHVKTQENEDPLEETAEAPKGGKMSKKSKKKAFDEDDIARELEELSLEVNGVLPPNKTENEKQSEGKDKAAKKDDEEGRVDPNIGGGFSALMDDMDDVDFDKEDQASESSVKRKGKKKEEQVAKPEPPPKKDKSKKKSKRRGNDEDELEDILAEIESEYTGEKKDLKTLDKKEKVEGTDKTSKSEPASKKEKSKKKSKRQENDEDEELEDILAEIESEYTGEKKELKTLDKKEKVEVTDKTSKSEPPSKKEKSKKKSKRRGNDDDNEDLDELLAKIESGNRGEKKELKTIDEKEEVIDKPSKSKGGKEKKQAREAPHSKNDKQSEKETKNVMEETKEDKHEKEKTPETDEQDDAGKTKAKDEEKEEGKTRKGKPNKKMLEAMKSVLAKQKVEEERRLKIFEEKRREEEEKIRRLEEQRRLEEEKKERQREKQKEKLRRLKEEGKILTPRQRQEQKRMQAMLEHLKAQGVTIPESGKGLPPPVYKKKKRKQDQEGAEDEDDAQAQESEPEAEADSEPDPEAELEQASEAEPVAEEKEEDNVVDAWDQLSESEEEKESHTQESARPKKAVVVEEVNKKEKAPEAESEDEHLTEAEKKRERAVYRLAQRKAENEKKKSLTRLRAPVVCVLGHVDHGKTKILDKLRRTNVQEGEVGGITQQIGATNVPFDAINSQTRMVKDFLPDQMTLPGLLIIDTPGHESFSNLRSRGSSLCDIAILVVDITQGLEPQTIESINLLKSKKTPFIVALNKVDRVFEWESYPTKDIRESIKVQNEPCRHDFERRSSQVIQALNIQGLNAALFWENPDPRSYVSLVPTSAISGDGMGNLMALISSMCQKRMASRLMLSEELQCTVLEVKTIQGHGTTIDVILVNGRLREGDTIVLAGTEGPIVTQIRSLLIPKPMKEIRVKGQYDELKEVQAALGVKIAARELEKAIAGLNMQVAHHEDEIDILKEEVDREFKAAMRSMKVKDKGVYVQASTLGALEALLEFFKANKVPYAGIRVGPVVKRDVMKATAMLEHDPMYAVILAFDVKVERDAQELADKEGIKIFSEETIYHLGDRYVEYIKEYKKKKQDEFKDVAVFPCRLKIIADSIFNKRDPIVLGVTVDVGILRTGTPLCVPTKEFVEIGVVTSLEYDHKAVEIAKRGVNVCMKVEPLPGHTPKMVGRHFDVEDTLVSKISRESIDACKEYFRDDLGKPEWKLMAELKKEFAIL